MNNTDIFIFFVFYYFYLKKTANKLFFKYWEAVVKKELHIQDWKNIQLQLNLLGSILYVLFLPPNIWWYVFLILFYALVLTESSDIYITICLILSIITICPPIIGCYPSLLLVTKMRKHITKILFDRNLDL